MALGSKSFVFNKNSDWKMNNYSHGVKIDGDCLIFSPNSDSNSVFFSKSIDSLEQDTSWGILKALIKSSNNSKVVFKVFASNFKDVVVPVGEEIEKVNIDKFLKSNANLNAKSEFFDKIGAIKFDNPEKVPIFNLKGRYLWFCVECINYSSDDCVEIQEIEITFPLLSFLEYLPEVYQSVSSDSFMNRFISIFQYMYLEIDEIIDNIPENFEPLYNNMKYLSWICEWFGINTIIWDENKLRYLIGDVIEIFKSKGTKKSIVDMVEKYTGFKPIIVEKFKILDNDFYSKESSFVDNLFGKNNFFFTVIMRENEIKKGEEYANLLKIIKNMSPIDAICNLVVLTNSIILGCHCYIGLNSYVSNSYLKNSSSFDSILVVS